MEVLLRKSAKTPRVLTIWKKVQKTVMFGALLEVQLRKSVKTPWVFNDLEVKNAKN